MTDPTTGEIGELVERLRPPAEFGPTCPFCAHDPFEYVDNGIGMEKVAVSCCDFGIALFQYHDEIAVRVVGLMSEAADTLSAYQDRIERLEEALRFYANAWQQDADAERTAHGWTGSIGPIEPTDELLNDFGAKARLALTDTTDRSRGQ